jgi:arylamine N-acetyltransferase
MPQTAVDRLLRHLRVGREAPTRAYLDRLVEAHQRLVPFETFTKLIDYEAGLRRGDFLPPFEEYVDRIVSRGAGGLCWTLARGFHALLDDLGFESSFMYMHPGHCCVRVELPEGPFYADVGYAAPLFRAYPLHESFRLDTPRETFAYTVGDQGVVVTRHPGPTKILDPTARRLEDLRDLITAANDWAAPESFLHRLMYDSYVDGVYTSLRDSTLRRYPPGGAETTRLDPAGVQAAMAGVFRADPALYLEADTIHRRYCSQTHDVRL